MAWILEFLCMEGHDRLPLLDPDKPPYTFWFCDNKVTRSVADTMKSYFVEPHVAPKKKNYTFGVGSIETVPAASSSQAHRRTYEDHAEENARLKKAYRGAGSAIRQHHDFFSIITMDSPNLARVVQERGVMPTKPPTIPPEQADAAAQELRRDLGIDDFDVDP
ncbi:unnamed protein product [Cochlearia groenlandica]